MRPAGATWFGDPTCGSFLTTVWVLDGAQPEWDGWVGQQMEKLRAEPDRMFAGRDHLHTSVYRFAHELRADDGVSAATALDHPHAGLVALATTPGTGAAAADAIVGAALPVAAVFTPERVILSQAEPPNHDLVLGFTRGAPIAAWEARVAPALAALDGVGFASPFLRTIPGTDAYTDEL